MVSIECLYCNELFNEIRRLPMKLECGHTLCNNCVEELKLYLTICPIDKNRVNFYKVQIDEQSKSAITNYCKLHRCKINGYCVNHLEFLCVDCSPYHKDCKSHKGAQYELDKRLSKSLNESVSNVRQIHKSAKQYNIEELDRDLQLVNTSYQNLVQNFQRLFMKVEGETDIDNLISILNDHIEIYNSSEVGALKSVLDSINNEGSQNAKPAFPQNHVQSTGNTAYGSDQRISFSEGYTYIYLPFSCTSVKTTHQEMAAHSYKALFTPNQEMELIINIIGIGRPRFQNESVIIKSLVFTNNGSTRSVLGSYKIEFNNGSMVCLIFLPEPIKIVRNTEFMVDVELYGKNYFLFTEPQFNKLVQLTVLEGYPANGGFPIAFFGNALNETKSSIELLYDKNMKKLFLNTP